LWEEKFFVSATGDASTVDGSLTVNERQQVGRMPADA
jgi:hypothetical protein